MINPVAGATASIATYETDARLAAEARQAGRAARDKGLPITACPYGGPMGQWWQQGWNGTIAGVKTSEVGKIKP